MTTKLNIADSASGSRRAANRTESRELLLHSEERDFDCEESPKTKAVEESLQNCCIVPEIRKEIHNHGLQVHCRLAGGRQYTN
jgi:hypothetical protein